MASVADFCALTGLVSLPLRPPWPRLRPFQSTIPIMSRFSLQVSTVPLKKVCLLQSRHNLFDYKRRRTHAFDFCVSSKRCSACMMSMTSHNFLLASFGAYSSAVRFIASGVLSHGITLPVCILLANARSGSKQTRCPCCIRADSHQRSSHLCLSRRNAQ